jgi:hypothetical protein
MIASVRLDRKKLLLKVVQTLPPQIMLGEGLPPPSVDSNVKLCEEYKIASQIARCQHGTSYMYASSLSSPPAPNLSTTHSQL